MKKNFLVTGGAGFFGSLFVKYLSDRGHRVVIFDRLYDQKLAQEFDYFHGDFRSEDDLGKCFKRFGSFDAVFHIGAELAHCMISEESLWTSNVDGTEKVIEFAIKYKVPHLIFTSSNCAVGKPQIRPTNVHEEDPINPLELYGKSKVEGEKILQKYSDKIHTVAFRCPTIITSGRLGLLTILFDFIREGRKVWVVGRGDNRYQFVFAYDLANACLLATQKNFKSGFNLYNIGTDRVKTMAQTYRWVINRAKTKARIAHLPKKATLLAMKVIYKLGISPLGPYHYGMIAENFVFNIDKIKKELGWKPTLTNEKILAQAYEYYIENFDEIHTHKDRSAHRSAAKMGAIKLLKWLS